MALNANDLQRQGQRHIPISHMSHTHDIDPELCQAIFTRLSPRALRSSHRMTRALNVFHRFNPSQPRNSTSRTARTTSIHELLH